MRKLVTSLAAVTAMAAGAGVFILKMTVHEKRDDLQIMAEQIRKDQETIRILEAEWAYLTAPHTLQDQSIRFLALMPTRARQIIQDPVVIPFRPRGVDVDAGENASLVRPVSMKTVRKKEQKKAEDAL